MMNPENKYVKYDSHSKLKLVLHKKHRAEADIAIPKTTHHGPKKVLLYFTFKSKYERYTHIYFFFDNNYKNFLNLNIDLKDQ